MSSGRPRDPVEWWWNGRYGRLVRRDLWLTRDDTGWHVVARRGDGDDPTITLDYTTEADARTELAVLLAEHGPWQRLTT